MNIGIKTELVDGDEEWAYVKVTTESNPEQVFAIDISLEVSDMHRVALNSYLEKYYFKLANATSARYDHNIYFHILKDY